MKRAIFLLGFCSALLLPPGALADVVHPGFPRRPHLVIEGGRPRPSPRRPSPRPPLETALADVKVQSGVGGIQLVFQLAGPGECEYTLRGPQQPGGGPGPVAAEGSRVAGGAGTSVLVEKVAIEPEPEENAVNRYLLVALCRMKVFEQTSFGSKETEEVREVRLSRKFFSLRRGNDYRVTREPQPRWHWADRVRR